MDSGKVEESPHTLYRFWSGEELLYVGISVNAYARAMTHRSTATWWPEATHVTFEPHPSRAAVLAAERAAILEERPRFNAVGAAPSAPTSQRSVYTVDTQRRIVLGRMLTPGERFDVYAREDRLALVRAEGGRKLVDDRRRISLGAIVEPGDLFRAVERAKGIELVRVALVDISRMDAEALEAVQPYLL